MFNNLVESDLHTQEHARRSWFFLGTLAAYVLLFMIAGVASIYAYDARLEEQTNEYIVTFVPPVEAVAPETPHRNEPPRSATNASNVRQPSERIKFIDRVTNPYNVPQTTSAVASRVPELPPNDVVLSNRNFDAGYSNIPTTPPGRTNTGGGAGQPNIDIPDTPPPAPHVAPAPLNKILKLSQVINSRAISLPKPPYPVLARNARVSGVVAVQVLIDETGKVVSAQAMSGHPLLCAAAVQAARQARFSPTVLGEQPVKVSGVITYNFSL